MLHHRATQPAKQAAGRSPSLQQRQQPVVSKPRLEALTSPLYAEPIEALAGKSWRQMAREAEQREDEEIAEKVLYWPAEP